MADQFIFTQSSQTKYIGSPIGLDREAQRLIIDGFWPLSSSALEEFASYFKYFQWTIDILKWPYNSATHQLATLTYGELATVAKCIRENIHCCRADILIRLSGHFSKTDDGKISHSMDLVLRLWLTMNIRSDDNLTEPKLLQTEGIKWNSQETLQQMLARRFQKKHVIRQESPNRIDPTFTVINLKKICGITLAWTANLLDHLRFDDATRTLHIYAHKVCLINHMQSNTVFPPDLLKETIQSLDLLFPFGHHASEAFLVDQGQPLSHTHHEYYANTLSIDDFQYWGDRLEHLLRIYSQAPDTLYQLWHDRRNPITYYTFWLAAVILLLTIIFGVISSYTALRQTYLAEISYHLAVLQACAGMSQPIPSTLLGHLCNSTIA